MNRDEVHSMKLKKLLSMILVVAIVITTFGVFEKTDVQAGASEIIGKYTGEYDGYSGSVVVRREIDINIKSISDGQIKGVAVLRPSNKAASKYGVNASYYFSGTYDPSTKKITMQGYQWIMYPVGDGTVGYWEFVYLDGTYNTSTKKIVGTSEEGIWNMKRVNENKKQGSVKATYHDGQMKKNYTDWAKYNDQYFYNGSSKVQGGLAKLSMLAAASAYNSSHARAFMKACKFNVDDIYYRNEANSLSYNDKVSFCIGLRYVLNDIIVAVWVKGTSADYEWISNFNVGRSGAVHQGFGIAKDAMKKQINNYLSSRGISIYDRNVKVWITGHSRGAAVANLYAADLKSKASNVYCYTFATPRVSQSGKQGGYTYIKNYINTGDFVTEVAPSKWNYKRFGCDLKLSANKKNAMKKAFKKKTGKKYAGFTKKGKGKLLKVFLKYAGKNRGKYYKKKTYKYKQLGKKYKASVSPAEYCQYGLAKALLDSKKYKQDYKDGRDFMLSVSSHDPKAYQVSKGMIYNGVLTPKFGQAHTQVTYIKWLEQMYK